MRPVTIRGKGFVFNHVTPHAGIREARVAGAYVMTLNLANVVHRQIYMGCFGSAMTRWAKALLHRGGTFVDVGAHAGYFSLVAAERVGPAGRVFAVEPNPVVFATLHAQLTANGISNVDACNWGLAERNGSLVLHVPRPDTFRDYNATLLARPGWTPIEIPVRRLDDCVNDWKTERIDLLKIDVEGAEPRVVAGGATGLTAGIVRHLMIEINGPRLLEAGSSPAVLVDQLATLGFEPARLARGRVIRVARAGVDLDPTHEHDCLFVHASALWRAS
jgi:FkbM family methyltransferase